jgi:hypothetical protein
MRILALGALLLAVGGCATAAQHEMTRMNDTSERAIAATDGCWSKAEAQDAFAALRTKVTLKFSVQPTLVQRADTGKPTAEERQTLSDLHRDWLMPCRNVMIDGSVAILPALHRTMMRYAEREDAVYAGLVLGRLTWGDANTELAAIRLETTNGMYDIASRTAQDLQRQHALEVERRLATLQAFAQRLGQAMSDFADYRIEAERRRQQSTPRHTICQNVGGYVSCTTY